MLDKQTIIQKISEALEPIPYVHALWLEGSDASGHDDEYSDIDMWVSVDDDMLKNIFQDIEKILETLGEIDFSYELKTDGELGHNVYHIAGTSQFLTLDINTQKLSRDVVLTKSIDDAKILFDKSNIIKMRERDAYVFNHDLLHNRLEKHVSYMSLSVEKNLRRNKILEAVNNYHAILQYVTKYLRQKSGWNEKGDFGLKHIYRDLPDDVVSKLEYFYFVPPEDLDTKLNELNGWIKEL